MSNELSGGFWYLLLVFFYCIIIFYVGDISFGENIGQNVLMLCKQLCFHSCTLWHDSIT